MFTGLVETTGAIRDMRKRDAGVDFFLDLPESWMDVAIGDSVAINGCCLTVVECTADRRLVFQAGRETLSRTNLGELAVGDRVNLERALIATDRLGGHLVTGHVDAVGTVRERIDEAEWSTFRFQVPRALTRQMASKGSVTVDGISLTLVDVGEDWFSIALIPHTLQVTTLGQRSVGDRVNIETDLLAKYVQQQLAWLGRL